MTMVVTCVFKVLDVIEVMSELQKLGIVKDTVGAESMDGRPRQQPLVPKEKRGSREEPQPSWKWAESEKEQQNWDPPSRAWSKAL